VNRLPVWRVAAAVLILAALAFFLATFTPIYLHNMGLQKYVSSLTQRADSRTKSDDLLRTLVRDKAHELGLPVMEDNVHVTRSSDGALKQIDVRYFVQVSLPGYTVNLHFYPGAGSR
jgi:hypothetical protein